MFVVRVETYDGLLLAAFSLLVQISEGLSTKNGGASNKPLSCSLNISITQSRGTYNNVH